MALACRLLDQVWTIDTDQRKLFAFGINLIGQYRFVPNVDLAGLPKCTAHGLRKATMRRMAELEMPNKTMKSVSGHKKDEEVARYIEAASQERLADGAIKQLSSWEMSNLKSELDSKIA